ncbi:MAG TPA: hypothetical protein VIQ05_22675 [Tardiphaga sp.]|jgi:hypothetical protein
MPRELNDVAIDEIIAACNGDTHGALKALLLVNEQLEAELQQLYAAAIRGNIQCGGKALH